MDLGLEGKVAVVTGASKGIGYETAVRLGAEGAKVLFVARSADALAEEAERCGGAVLALDVTAPDAADRIVGAAVERFGGIDVLVNNAGTSFARPLDELTEADWQAQWELHVMASMRLMRAAAPRMAARGWGRIVNVTSSAAKRPSLTNAAYSVTKAAQQSLSRVFAEEYAASGVLVNAVAPGATASPLWVGPGGLAEQTGGGSREDGVARQVAKIPIGRMSEPAEIADIILFLCSERASSVTGSAWSVDGGAVQTIM
ncbi:MAG TPA: SDR family oxidoreductase [Solirubrobacteraceae bacterium]|nr:SDR family oxidoreductase [Solirubrobacteraceae bacterium]